MMEMASGQANDDLLVDVAASGRALAEPGHGSESGDLHLVAPFPGGALVAVIDGLGHGTEAAAAAQAAARVLAERPDDEILDLVKRCHEALRRTRGAVMSVACFRAADSSITWIGIGNVEGFLYRADPFAMPRREVISTRGGVIGHRLPPLRAASFPVRSGDTLIMVTDGIRSRFTANIPFERRPHEIASGILAQHDKGTDDALVLVARYRGPRP